MIQYLSSSWNFILYLLFFLFLWSHSHAFMWKNQDLYVLWGKKDHFSPSFHLIHRHTQTDKRLTSQFKDIYNTPYQTQYWWLNLMMKCIVYVLLEYHIYYYCSNMKLLVQQLIQLSMLTTAYMCVSVHKLLTKLIHNKQLFLPSINYDLSLIGKN